MDDLKASVAMYGREKRFAAGGEVVEDNDFSHFVAREQPAHEVAAYKPSAT